jgi:anti-sigma-K factor RskA
MRHTELTDDLQERASLYAAGAMTDSERQEYARHLDEDQCPVCRSEVRELQSAISLMAFTTPSSSPSPNVKRRLMEQAEAAKPARDMGLGWFQWVTTAVAVASLAATFVLMRANNELRRTTAELNSRIAQLEVELAGQRNDLALLTSAGIRIVNLAGQGSNVQASGRIFVDEQGKRWVFSVRGLPPAASDKSYQLWFVPKMGDPIDAGTFNPQADGSLRIEVRVPDNATDLKAAAVTIEPLGGRPQPTGPFALLGAL